MKSYEKEASQKLSVRQRLRNRVSSSNSSTESSLEDIANNSKLKSEAGVLQDILN